jgi:hypothetical protein
VLLIVLISRMHVFAGNFAVIIQKPNLQVDIAVFFRDIKGS